MTSPIPMLRVLAIPGSLRRESWNRRLLAHAAVLAGPRMQVDLYDDLRDVPMFDEDLEASTGSGPDAVRHLRAAVAAADGLLIATPEYNHSLPGVLKNAIDWLSRATPTEVLAGKPVAIVGASSGRWGTRLAQAALRQVLAATEAAVLPATMRRCAMCSLRSTDGSCAPASAAPRRVGRSVRRHRAFAMIWPRESHPHTPAARRHGERWRWWDSPLRGCGPPYGLRFAQPQYVARARSESLPPT